MVSTGSWWEIAIKFGLKKLELPYFLPDTYQQAQADGFHELPIRPAHLLTIATLPHHHGDPFDRLLIDRPSPHRQPDARLARSEI